LSQINDYLFILDVNQLPTGCIWETKRMKKPILDKAEVALEYPEKFYGGTFEPSSRYEAFFND
jgi:hypothetical protein